MLADLLRPIDRQTILKFVAKFTALVIALCVAVVLLVATLFLTSDNLRIELTQALVKKVNSSSTFNISVIGLNTSSIEHWEIKKIQIKDNGHLILDGSQLVFQWQAAALLDKALIIESVSALDVNIYRPVDKNTSRQQQAIKFENLHPLEQIQIKALSVETLDLVNFTADSTKAYPLSYAIEGNTKWQKNAPLYLNLEAHTRAGKPAELSIKTRAENSNSAIVEGTFSEEAGGFIGQLLSLPEEQAIAAKFHSKIIADDKKFSVKLTNFEFPLGARKLALETQFSLQKTNLNLYLDNLELVVDETKHKVMGSWVDGELDFNLALNGFPLDLANYWVSSIDDGDLSAQLQISGSIQNPVLQGKITANSAYNSQPFSLNFDGFASREEIEFQQLHASFADAEIDAKGRLNLAEENSNISILVKQFDIAMLEQFEIELPSELQATIISANAKLQGPIKNPQGTIELAVRGNYKQQAFTLAGDAKKVLNTVTVGNTLLTLEEGEAEVVGEFHTESLQGNLNITSRSLPLSLAELAGIALPDSLVGSTNTNIQLSGVLTKPAIKGQVSIDGNFRKIPFNSELSGNFEDDKVLLDKLIVYAFDDEVLSAKGSYFDEKFGIDLEATKLPTELLAALGWRPQAGQFNAKINAHGTVQAPTIDGTVYYQTVMQGFDDNGDQKPVAFSWALKINTADDALKLLSTFKRDDNIPGEIAVDIPTSLYARYFSSKKTAVDYSNPPLSAAINGSFDLQTLSFLLDPDLHRLRGNINADFTIDGTLQNPSINGFLTTDKASYDNTITGTTVSDINCSMSIQQSTMQIDNCQSTDGDDGIYAIDGEVKLPFNGETGNILLELQANSANILQQPSIEGDVTGNIVVRGNFEEVFVNGTLDVSPFTALTSSAFNNDTPSIKVEEIYGDPLSTKKPRTFESALPLINLDLQITASHQAYLRGHGLDAELQGDILIKGSLQRPQYGGEFETVRGVFEVFGKKFDLENGRVTFTNSAIGLSITGVYRNNEREIRAMLVGSNDDINLSLSSIPSMPEDEILAFVLFGKSIQKITPFQAIQLASAVRSLRSDGSSVFDPIGKTRDILGVDTLSVETQKTDKGEYGVNVGIGKYLNEDVYLEVERTPNPSQPWKGNIEVELTPNMTLKSTTGGKTGLEGAEINWKRDY